MEKQNKVGKQTNNIKVFIRMRPLIGAEVNDKPCVNLLNEKQMIVSGLQSKENPQKEKHSFAFDKIFQQDATQKEVYEDVSGNIIANIFQGINGTVFCYGQTSSGKTYTCLGDDFVDEKTRGILPRIVEDILSKMEVMPKHIQCSMKMSVIQIYNQRIKDLLDPIKNDLKIRQNKSQGIFIGGVTEKYILSPQESNYYISKGIENRSVAATLMNLNSSRSHMMITLTVHQHDLYSGIAKSSKLILVDLAGCQKISRTGAEGKVLEEAKKINTSLSVLGKVIKTLSDGKKSHIPYRDSKLTRLLQESLGGNCITNLIINISPASCNYNETTISLRFGSRAKSIKNQPKVNQEYTVPELLQLLNKAQKKIKQQNDIIAGLLKGSSDFTSNNALLESFLQSYEQDKNRQKALQDFKSDGFGSVDYLKKTTSKGGSNTFLFKDVTECLEQENCNEFQDISFGSSKQKPHTNSLTALFRSFDSPKINRTESLIQMNKSAQSYKLNRKNFQQIDNEEDQPSLRNVREKQFKPLIVPNFIKAQSSDQDQELLLSNTQLQKSFKKQNNNKNQKENYQISISNMDGHSSNGSQSNNQKYSFEERISQEKTINVNVEETGVQYEKNYLSVINKQVDMFIEPTMHTNSFSHEESSEKSNQESCGKVERQTGCKSDKASNASNQEGEPLHYPLNSNIKFDALKDLQKIRQNMRKMASLRNRTAKY